MLLTGHVVLEIVDVAEFHVIITARTGKLPPTPETLEPLVLFKQVRTVKVPLAEGAGRLPGVAGLLVLSEVLPVPKIKVSKC